MQTVIDDGGDIPLIRTVRLLFNERGNNEDLLKRIAGLLHLRHQLIVHALREVVEQAADGVRRVLVDEELIGVREEVALQLIPPVLCGGDLADERIVAEVVVV